MRQAPVDTVCPDTGLLLLREDAVGVASVNSLREAAVDRYYVSHAVPVDYYEVLVYEALDEAGAGHPGHSEVFEVGSGLELEYELPLAGGSREGPEDDHAWVRFRAGARVLHVWQCMVGAGADALGSEYLVEELGVRALCVPVRSWSLPVVGEAGDQAIGSYAERVIVECPVDGRESVLLCADCVGGARVGSEGTKLPRDAAVLLWCRTPPSRYGNCSIPATRCVIPCACKRQNKWLLIPKTGD